MPQSHLIYGLFFSACVYFIYPTIGILGFSLIWLSSIFIDLDHAVRFTIKTGSINPIKFLEWSYGEHKRWKNLKNKNQYKLPFFACHGIEFIAMLAILTIFTSWAKYVLIGALFHLILDYMHLIKHKRVLMSKMSQVWVLIRNSKKST